MRLSILSASIRDYPRRSGGQPPGNRPKTDRYAATVLGGGARRDSSIAAWRASSNDARISASCCSRSVSCCCSASACEFLEYVLAGQSLRKEPVKDSHALGFTVAQEFRHRPTPKENDSGRPGPASLEKRERRRLHGHAPSGIRIILLGSGSRVCMPTCPKSARPTWQPIAPCATIACGGFCAGATTPTGHV